MSTRRTTALLPILLLALGLGLPRPALAAEPVRRVGLGFVRDALKVSFSYRDLFSKRVRTALASGLQVRVVLQAGLEPAGGGEAVAYFAQTATVVYDLWEERFQVTVDSPAGREQRLLATVDEVVDHLGVLRHRTLLQTAGAPGGDYRLRFVAEINPVSAAMVSNIKRWLSRPEGRSAGSSRSFLGAFVGSFVDRRLGAADATVEFVSQTFTLDGP